MPSTQQMLQTHPSPMGLDAATLTEFINSALECAQTCTACADACLAEDMVAELRYCIRTNLDCADICDTTARMVSRQTQPNMELLRTQVQACALACKTCGDECERHASMHEHCRVCAESCRRCEQACNQLLSAISA